MVAHSRRRPDWQGSHQQDEQCDDVFTHTV
jgi:hypothetical protein